jgi:hypothetical protein
MTRQTRRIVATLLLLAGLYLAFVLLASVNQVAELAARLDPALGTAVFWLAVATFLTLAGAAVVMYVRLPPPLIPPGSVSGPDYDRFLVALRQRLRENPRLEGVPVDTPVEIESALERLAAEAEGVTRQAATRVFLATALLQNGRLDGLVVLATQIRLVWRIAGIFYQRPSPRHIAYLYSNVAGTVFVATGLEEIDFAEMVKPLVFSVAPALQGGVPGLSGVGALLVNSLSSGAANAFLTLRVGAVAQRYCGTTMKPERSVIRRSATASAATHLGRIVAENAAFVVKSVWGSVKGLAQESLGRTVAATKAVGGRFSAAVRRKKRPPPDEATAAPPGVPEPHEE